MTIHKISQKTALATAVVTGLVFLTGTANAASQVTINPSTTGSSTISTTVIEQSADGQIATITATPNSISMQSGVPYTATQVATVPSYSINQSSATVINRGPITSQVTQQIGNTVVTMPTTMPVNTTTQVLNVNGGAIPVLAGQQVIAPPVTSQVTSIDNLQSIQLNPTFSTPGMANAQTKVMKILKNSTGQEFAVPANHIAPGDVIEYHTTYTNTTTQPLRDVNAVVSLPNGLQLVSLNSPFSTMGSMSGNNYQTIQQMGNSVVVQENYSGLRWNLANLATDAPQTIVIRAKVQ